VLRNNKTASEIIIATLRLNNTPGNETIHEVVSPLSPQASG